MARQPLVSLKAKKRAVATDDEYTLKYFASKDEVQTMPVDLELPQPSCRECDLRILRSWVCSIPRM